MQITAIKEIANCKAQIEATKLLLDSLDGMSRSSLGEIKKAQGNGLSADRMVNLIDRRDRVRLRLADDYERYIDVMEQTLAELDAVKDVRIRSILVLRFVQGYRWEQVAKTLGGSNTADSCKKICERFLASGGVKPNAS